MAEERIAVIGAGIVGVATALWLRRDGHRVILVDRQPPGEATSFGNAGVFGSVAMVPVTMPGLERKAPFMLIDRDSPLFLRWSYLPKLAPWLWRYLSHCKPAECTRVAEALAPIVGDSLNEHLALARGTPAEAFITPSDLLYVYDNRQAFEAEAFAWSLRRKHGFRWEEMDGAGFRAYDPGFGGAGDFVIRLDEHAHVKDPGLYVKALAQQFRAEGGESATAEVRDFAFDGARLRGLQSDGGEIECTKAVVAGGAWSARLTDRLGLKVPLESERGYHMEFHAPSILPRAPMMMAQYKFVATPMAGRLRCAGLVEFGGLEAGPSEAPFELLERQVRAAFPDMTFSHTTRWMGHRPATTDSIPVIGAIARHPDVTLAFGHHHIGLTGSARTGRLVADLIAGRHPNIDVTVYQPERFSH